MNGILQYHESLTQAGNNTLYVQLSFSVERTHAVWTVFLHCVMAATEGWKWLSGAGFQWQPVVANHQYS